jgi:hypothetical protein
MTRRHIVVCALLLLGAAGCGTDAPAPPTTSSGPARSADDYADCLRDKGLVLEEYTAEDGLTRVRPDKAKNDVQAIADATAACTDHLPTGESSPATVSAEDIAARQRYAACIRDHGVSEFPDPDPVTGDFTMDDATAAQVKDHPSMRTAMEACRSILPGGNESGVVGG